MNRCYMVLATYLYRTNFEDRLTIVISTPLLLVTEFSPALRFATRSAEKQPASRLRIPVGWSLYLSEFIAIW